MAKLIIEIPDEQLINEDISNAITGAVKSHVRSMMHETINKEIERIIDARVRSWTMAAEYGRENPLKKIITQAVDNSVRRVIDDLPIGTVSDAVKAKYEQIDSLISSAINARMGKYDIGAYVKTAVDTEVKRAVPETTLKAIVGMIGGEAKKAQK